MQEPSRYMTEFIEVDFIAKGGFGCVFKAQHKLDGIIYAVKKILLRFVFKPMNLFNVLFPHLSFFLQKMLLLKIFDFSFGH